MTYALLSTRSLFCLLLYMHAFVPTFYLTHQAAAVLTEAFRARCGPGVRRVCVVLSGGNQDLDDIPWK